MVRTLVKPDKVRYVQRNIFHVSMVYFSKLDRTGTRASNIPHFRQLQPNKMEKICCLVLFCILKNAFYAIYIHGIPPISFRTG